VFILPPLMAATDRLEVLCSQSKSLS